MITLVRATKEHAMIHDGCQEYGDTEAVGVNPTPEWGVFLMAGRDASRIA
jgi:hypothetical protein